MTRTELSRREDLESFFHRGVPIAKTMGMTLKIDDKGSARVTLPYNPDFDHGHQGIHGGVYMTLLDTAAWFTSAVTHEKECWIATSEMAVHFLGPASRTELTAVGRILKSGKRQDIVEVMLYDAEGTAVGQGVGTFTILPLKSPRGCE